MRGNGSTISGTASQYVMGNGTLLFATYPTITTEGNFTTTFNCGGAVSASITISIRKISNGTNSVVHLFIPQVIWTTGAGGGTASSTSALPLGVRPSVPGGSNYNLSVV